MKDLVFCINKHLSSATRSIHQLNRDGYTIKQPEPKYYMGFEVRSYEGENIIIGISDDSIEDCNYGSCCVLREVKQNCFVSEYDDSMWKYAVLIPCNNHNLKLKA